LDAKLITSIKISNFKAFGECRTIEFDNLTILAGMNSSGKSSIHQALSLISKSSEVEAQKTTDVGRIPILTINSDELTVGKTGELQYSEDNKETEFTLGFSDGRSHWLRYRRTPDHSRKGEYFLLSGVAIESTKKGEQVFSALHSSDGWEIKASTSLLFENNQIASIIKEVIQQKSKKKDIEVDFKDTVKFTNLKNLIAIKHQIYSFSVPMEQISECVGDECRMYLDLDLLNEKLTKNKIDTETFTLVNDLFMSFPFGLPGSRDIKSIPAFRGFPQRVYTEGVHPNPLVSFANSSSKKIKYRIDPKSEEHVTGTFDVALKYWVCEYFELADDLEVKENVEGYSSEILLKMRGKWIPINNVGFGVSQVLPIIYNTLLSPKSDLLIIDEAEIHLHPRLQSRLGAFFLQMAELGRRVILETHSEYLINNVIYAITDRPSLKKLTKMYWTQMGDKGAEIKEIVYDEMGYITNSPPGFNDEQRATTEKLTNLRLKKIQGDEPK
jgi:AAA15 family ATPase/GTPase